MGQRPVITVAGEAGIVKTHTPAEHHVLQAAAGFRRMGLVRRAIASEGWRLHADKPHTLAGIEHHRIPINHAHDPPGLAALEAGHGIAAATAAKAQ